VNQEPHNVIKNPTTAQHWRTVQAGLLVDHEAWLSLADAVIVQPTLPRLLAEDYAAGVSRGYRQMAQAALDAADQAGLYAAELEDAVAVAS
jgi:hypothetical protein